MSIFATPIPSGFKFSAKTQKLIEKRDELWKQYRNYQSQNADCARRKKDPYDTSSNPVTYVPALVRASRELHELETKAVAEGKPMPDPEKHMAEAKARVTEYERKLPALRAAHEAAAKAVEHSIYEELPSLASQAMRESEKARKDYVTALEKAENSRAKMHGHLNRLVWAISGGSKNQHDTVGYDRFRLGSDIDLLETTEDGKLTEDSANALLGRFGHLELSDFVAEEPKQMEPYHTHDGILISRTTYKTN